MPDRGLGTPSDRARCVREWTAPSELTPIAKARLTSRFSRSVGGPASAQALAKAA